MRLVSVDPVTSPAPSKASARSAPAFRALMASPTRSCAFSASPKAAAAAYGDAERAHDRVGDAIRARNAGADRALALLGAGDAAGSTESRRIFAQKSNPRTNNPDDIPLLQELSRKDAELHLALGAKLAAKGDAKDATALWETGCVRLRTYVDDATARIVADDVRGSARIKYIGA